MKRNEHHSRISKKYGVNRVIVFETDNEQLAFLEEIHLIDALKTYAYENENWGANYTRGGDGCSGYKFNDDQRNALREALCLAWKEHPELRELHSQLMTKKNEEWWKDSEYRQNQRVRLERYWSDVDARMKQSLLMKETLKKFWSDPVNHEKASSRLKSMWESDDYRQKMENVLIEFWSDPQRRKKHSEEMSVVMTEKWKCEDFREKMTRALKRGHNTEEARQSKRAVWSDPEIREKIVTSMRGVKRSEETKERMRKPKSPEHREKLRAILSRCREEMKAKGLSPTKGRISSDEQRQKLKEVARLPHIKEAKRQAQLRRWQRWREQKLKDKFEDNTSEADRFDLFDGQGQLTMDTAPGCVKD